MSDLSIQQNSNGAVLEILLDGSLNETLDLSGVDLGSASEIHIDFNGVTSINSTGINKWVQWTQKLEEVHRGKEVNFCNCPKIIIDQINAVKGFMPNNARIESFWIPFYCEESDRREFLLLTRGKDFMESTSDGEQWINIPDCNCSETSTPCEPDIMPAKYFAFMSRSS